MSRTSHSRLCLIALLLCISALSSLLPAAGSVTRIERVLSVAEHDSLVRLLAEPACAIPVFAWTSRAMNGGRIPVRAGSAFGQTTCASQARVGNGRNASARIPTGLAPAR